MSARVHIGLGSNQGASIDILLMAIEDIRHYARDDLIDVSGFYRTQPVGPQNQADFINAVIALRTELSPKALLDRLQLIEEHYKRQRSEQRWGPRTLDLDILLYNNQKVVSETLMIPHPRMAQRRFVLKPLMDIDPDIEIPGYGIARTCLNRCDPLRVEEIEITARTCRVREFPAHRSREPII